MSEHYDFHYQPTGSGAISGQQVLQQTEDAINELGDYVNDNVGGAMDVAQQALETAQNAEQDAQTALDTANSFSDAIQSAQQDASTALSTAQTAQTTASNANNTAIQAQQDASSAVTTANNASGQVSTLSGTVTALGQRVTTAEGNIGQNTSDITALTTRVGTAEGNITTLQNDVTIAQGNASSAMATAGQVKQQAFVFRYSSTALTPSSTNSNALLDNTDNLKVGDKVIDSSGVLFSITAIDTQNSTFTIGTALIDLAQDSDVVHKSGNETIAGEKNFQNTATDYSGIKLEGTRVCHITADNTNDSVFPSSACGFSLLLPDGNKAIHIGQWTSSNNRIFLNKSYPYMSFNGSILRANTYVPTGETNTATLRLISQLNYADDTNKNVDIRLIQYDNAYSALYSNTDNVTSLGVATRRWSKIYGTEYYYGANNVEFSTKFVTTDTAQTISGNKTFSDNISAKKIISNVAQLQINARSNADSVAVIAGADASDGGGIWLYGKNSVNKSHVAIQVYDTNASTFHAVRLNMDGSLTPTVSNNGLGSSSFKWRSFNGLNPGALGMPDLDNGIDISSYIPALDSDGKTQGSYTPSVNGFIAFRGVGNGCSIVQGNIGNNVSYVTNPQTSAKVVNNFLPVVKDNPVVITAKGLSSIELIYFYPCQGNV